MRRLVAALAMGSAVAATSVLGFSSSLLDGLAAQADDLLQPGTESTGDVVVVAIDRETLAAVGEAWPWPRGVHAELLDAIADAEPDVVVYDVVFADEGAGDGELADAMRRVPTVLASALTLSGSRRVVADVVDNVGPNDELVDAAAGVGHANVSVSQSRGVVRTLPFYARDDRGIVVPSLAAATFAALAGTDTFVERGDGLQIGDRLVPLDHGELRINYASELVGPETVISAVSLMDGPSGALDLRGKIVVVGVTEATLGDLHLVPTDKSGSVSGVSIHANAINTVASRAWIQPAEPARQAVWLALLAMATVAAFVLFRLRYAVPIATFLIVVSIAWSSVRFTADGVVWDLVWPVVSVTLAAAVATVWRYVTEYRHRRRAQQLFAEYVPDDVVELLSNASALERATAGVRTEVSLLFCDLRGFTPIAGRLAPTDVRRLLDHYYGFASAIIQRHKGTVLQFVGDEVFAVFGAPVASDTSASDAVLAARDLVDRIGDLDTALDAAGLPRLTFGVGLHRGEVIAAHVGTSAHRQYAVIGDPVNVGSRLCSRAAAGEVVASELALVDSAGFEAGAEVELKGVASAMVPWTYQGRLDDQLDGSAR